MSFFDDDNSEIRFIRALKSSDKNALKAFYDKYYEPLYRYLWRKTRNETVSQDLVQELFIKLWDNRQKLEEKDSLKAYLYKAATNLAIDHLRKKITQQTYFTESPEEMDSPYNLEKEVEAEDRTTKILQALPDGQREVFVLSRFERFKYAEIAEILGISIRTVEDRMSKALKSLRDILKNSNSIK